MDDVLCQDWRCIRCDNAYAAAVTLCEICDLPRFYSQTEVDALLQQYEQKQQRLAGEWERLRQEKARLYTLQQQLAA